MMLRLLEGLLVVFRDGSWAESFALQGCSYPYLDACSVGRIMSECHNDSNNWMLPPLFTLLRLITAIWLCFCHESALSTEAAAFEQPHFSRTPF